MIIIINGKKYNTETSVLICRYNKERRTESEWGGVFYYDETWEVYKTQKGKYFEVFTKKEVFNEKSCVYGEELSTGGALTKYYKYEQHKSECEAFPGLQEE